MGKSMRRYNPLPWLMLPLVARFSLAAQEQTATPKQIVPTHTRTRAKWTEDELKATVAKAQRGDRRSQRSVSAGARG